MSDEVETDPGAGDAAMTVCAEAYQAVGFLADVLGYWEMADDDPRQHQITKLLDNLSAAAEGSPIPHADLLPFGQLWPRARPTTPAAAAGNGESDGNHS